MATVHNLSALSSLLLQAGQRKNTHSHFLFQAPALASSGGPASPCHSSKPANGSEVFQWRHYSVPTWEDGDIPGWYGVGVDLEKPVTGV